MGVRIVLADHEPIDLALRRLKKSLERNGVRYEMRRREAFQKPTQKRRAKAFQKRFKARLATLGAQAGDQRLIISALEANKAFWKKTGKP